MVLERSEIESSDGIAMANTGAWHGLGTVVDHAMSVEEAPKDPEVGNCFRITERDIVSLELQVVRLECKTFIEAAEAEWSLRHNVGVAVERLKPAAAGNVICLETRDPVTGEWQVR